MDKKLLKICERIREENAKHFRARKNGGWDLNATGVTAEAFEALSNNSPLNIVTKILEACCPSNAKLVFDIKKFGFTYTKRKKK